MKAWKPESFTKVDYALGLYRPRRLGLVVQGGGMRGVYSMAALHAIAEFCPPSTFDFVLGTSSGAVNAAYYLADQSEKGRRVYEEDLASPGYLGGHFTFIGPFTNVLRFWRMVNIEVLMRIIRGEGHASGLDIDHVRNFSGDFLVGLSEGGIANPFYVEFKDLSVEEGYEALRATVALPAVYNRKVEIGGSQFVDGALIDSLPILRAFAFGCERVVVVTTREPDYRSTSDGDLLGRLGRIRTLGSQSTAVRRWLGLPNPVLDANMEYLQANVENGADADRLFAIFPSEPDKLIAGWNDLGTQRVMDCAEMGFQDALNRKDELLSWLKLDDHPST